MNTITRAIVMDLYTRKARLYPPLLAAMPVAITAAALYPAGLTPWTAAWGLLTWAGVTYLLAQFGGERGKDLEPWLFQQWGGKPTTVRLRHRDSANPALLARYHRRLQSLVPDQRLPSAAEEAANADAADQIYDAAVALLRNRTRDRNAFPLVFDHLCSYGFRRNLWGLKPVGLLSNVASLAVIAIVQIGGRRWSIEPVAATVVTATVIDALFLMAWLRITPNWVRRAADNYADSLLESCDAAEPARSES